MRSSTRGRTPSLVIPHGTTWGLMTPRGFDLRKELETGQHDPERQRLFEVLFGTRGTRRSSSDWPGTRTHDDPLVCPAPDGGLPALLLARGGRSSRLAARSRRSPIRRRPTVTRARERPARTISRRAPPAHLTVPGADVDDWLDCDQCRDCFAPPYSHRPRGSAQNALALRSVDDAGRTHAYRFGLIGASDTHDARPGNGFKEFARLENTEANARSPLTRRLLSRDVAPVARSREVSLADVPLAGRRYTERGASYLLTGGLTAAHADSRRREDLWSAFERREVYATSGDRILLWFDLLNAPQGARPMGSIVAGQVTPAALPCDRRRSVRAEAGLSGERRRGTRSRTAARGVSR